MAYATYTTEAIVCGSSDSYTSDRSYLLFAREAGMLWATARSVREEKSKQRSALQDFSIIRVSLVKGKSGWRIGSVEARGNPFLRADTRKKRGLVAFVVMQLRRYVQGESPLVSMYEDAVGLLTSDLSLEEESVAQSVFLLRLLSTLGYIAPRTELSGLIEPKNIKDALSNFNTASKTLVEKTVAEAAHVSHL